MSESPPPPKPGGALSWGCRVVEVRDGVSPGYTEASAGYTEASEAPAASAAGAALRKRK